MPNFTAPTYDDNIRGRGTVNGSNFQKEKTGGGYHTLMSHYVLAVPYTVIIVGGVASELPGLIAPTDDVLNSADAGSGDRGLAIFTNGRDYEITAGEAAALDAAGYTTT